MRIFFLFLLVNFTILASDTLDITQNNLPTTTLGYTYFIPELEQKTSQQILTSAHLIKAKKLNLGIIEGPVWTRERIKNTSLSRKNLVFYNERAGIDYIDTYIYKNGLCIKHHNLGDMRPQNQKEVLSRLSLFVLDMDPGDEVTIISKVQNLGVYTIGWHIEESYKFFQNDLNISILFGFLGGFLVVYLIVNLVLYINFKDTMYLLLASTVLSVILYCYSVYGYLYSFNIGIPLHLITTFSWISPLFGNIFLWLFLYSFFNVKSKYKIIEIIVKTVVITYIFIILLTLYMIYFAPALFKYYNFITIVYFLTPMIILGIAIFLVIKKENSSFYYLLGQLAIVSTNILHTFKVLGFSPIDFYTPLILPTGLVIEMLVLSLLVYQKSKSYILLQQKEKEILMEQLRFISIGQAVGGIVHQWKVPITYLGNIVTALETSLHFDKQNTLQELEKYLPELANNIQYMSEVSEELLNQYKTHSRVKSFNPKTVIENNILKVLSSKVTLKNLHIQYHFEKDLILRMDENVFVNIVMILIDNSLDASINNVEIVIEIKEIDFSYLIVVSDNCGGIDTVPIEKIFDYQFSTKNEGHGIGMAILKMLIIDKLKGEIQVINIEKGSQFRISFPKNI